MRGEFRRTCRFQAVLGLVQSHKANQQPSLKRLSRPPERCGGPQLLWFCLREDGEVTAAGQKLLAGPPGSCGAGGGLHGCAEAGRAALGDGKRASGLASACWLCDRYTRSLKRSRYRLSGKMSQRVKPRSHCTRGSSSAPGCSDFPLQTY